MFIWLAVASVLGEPMAAVDATAPSTNGSVASPQARAPEHVRLIDPEKVAPERLFAPPPAPNSSIEAIELARIQALQAQASEQRLTQAKRDGDDEAPDAFNQALARDITRLPKTLAFMLTIQSETEIIVDTAKAYFGRLRPYARLPQVARCGQKRNLKTGYPSGHAAFGWSVGWALSRLMPERAPQLLARAEDYALSRELCGSHYRSDLEASHAAGIFIAEQLLADPRLAETVAEVRAELATPLNNSNLTKEN